MALSLEQLRAAFKNKVESEGSEDVGMWDNFYPFFKADYGQDAIVRFVADADTENPLSFVVENRYHTLKINGKKKTIGCSKMYGKPCVCCDKSQEFYNGGNEAIGKMFWRKIDIITQGFVMSSPFDFPIGPEDNPIKMFSFMSKLYQKIETSIIKGDLDEMPFDLQSGYDFRITKIKSGDFADYTSSDFARKSTPVPEGLIARMVPFDLKKHRYPFMEQDKMEAIVEAFLTGGSLSESSTPASSTGNAGLDQKLTENKSVNTEATIADFQNATNVANTATPGTDAKKLTPQEILAKFKAKQGK